MRNTDEKAVVRTVSDALHDVEAGNTSGFTSHLAPDFYMYDRGKSLNTTQLFAQLNELQSSGTRLHWNVTSPDVHIHGSAAWIAYINSGDMTTPGGVIDRSWLESVFLVKKLGVWKIEFWHSTPVPDRK